MASVKGIGGVFIYSPDASRLAAWYEEVLGIEMEPHPDGIGYYRVFFTRDIETSGIRENPVIALIAGASAVIVGARRQTVQRHAILGQVGEQVFIIAQNRCASRGL